MYIFQLSSLLLSRRMAGNWRVRRYVALPTRCYIIIVFFAWEKERDRCAYWKAAEKRQHTGSRSQNTMRSVGGWRIQVQLISWRTGLVLANWQHQFGISISAVRFMMLGSTETLFCRCSGYLTETSPEQRWVVWVLVAGRLGHYHELAHPRLTSFLTFRFQCLVVPCIVVTCTKTTTSI